MLKALIKGQEVQIDDSERTKCEVWSRVMGYYRPIDGWNIGKKQEFKDRKFFNEHKTTEIIKQLSVKNAVA